MRKLLAIIVGLIVILLPLLMQAQGPVVHAADTPLYPTLGVQARVEGTVTLLVKTDGKSIVDVKTSGAHQILQDAAEKNVRTWQLGPHTPTTFKVEFIYKLMQPVIAEIGNCSVKLNFPSRVEITTHPVAVQIQNSY
jgi:hypothetical protein